MEIQTSAPASLPFELSKPIFSPYLLFSSEDTPYVDLKVATEGGCRAFLSLASPIGPINKVIVTFGFQNLSDCSQLAAMIAKKILEAATTECRSLIFDTLGMMECLVAPPFASALNGASDNSHDDIAEDMLTDEQWEALNAPLPEIHELMSDSFTMQFDDPHLEAAFAAANNAHFIKMDIGGIVLFCASLSIIYFTSFTKIDMSQVTAIQLLRAWILSLPMLLLFNSRTRAVYIIHRESIVIYYYIILTTWIRYMKLFMDCMDAEDFTNPLHMLGFAFLSIVILTFNARFRLLLPLVLACFAINCTFMPTICSRFYPESPLTSCVFYQVSKVLLVVVFPSLLIVRWLEKRARANFLNKLYES